MRLGGVDVVAAATGTIRAFRAHDLTGRAAEVAYHVLFAAVPLLIFLTALSGFVGRAVGTQDAMASITRWLFAHLPASAAQALRQPIEGVVARQAGGLLSVGALLALWGGHNALGSLMKALNVAFRVADTRPWWRRTAIALGLTVALGVAVVGASAVFLAGTVVGAAVARLFGLGATWTAAWAILRWPLIAGLLVAALAFLYWAGPDVDAAFRWLTPGSVLVVVLWGLATFGLGVYFRHFASYARTYGTLGGVLAFVFWIYVMAALLLLGGQLNAVLARRHDPATRADVAAHPLAPANPDAAHAGAAGGSAQPSQATAADPREAG